MDYTKEERELPELSRTYKKPNWLIEAKYKSSILEEKIMAVALSKVDESTVDPAGNIVVEIKASELRKLLGTNSGSFYTQLNTAAKSITGKSIGISRQPDATNPDGSFQYDAVVSHCQYGKSKTHGESILTIEFNHHLKKYIKDLKENYSLLLLQRSLKFKNLYAYRLYELLRAKCYPHKGDDPNRAVYDVSFLLSELKLELGIVAQTPEVRKVLITGSHPDYDKAVEKAPEKMYNTWKDFRDSVLVIACKEINEKSELKVDFDKQGAGRGGRVYKILFHVEYLNKKPVQKKIAKDPFEILEFIDQMKGFITETLSAKDLGVIAETSEYDIDKVKQAYEVAKKQPNGVNNLTGFMIKAIKEGYEVVKTTSSNGFKNFEQRDYDFDEIEKIVEGN